MTDVSDEPATERRLPPGAEPEAHPSTPSDTLRRLLPIVVMAVALGMLWGTFGFLRDGDANRLLVVAVAIVVGVGGVFAMYWCANSFVDWLPVEWRERVRPYVFVAPALLILGVFLIYPVLNTIVLSFKDARSQEFVGLDNYEFVFTDESMRRSLRNTALWIVLVPLVATSVGLVFATLADRLRRGEAVAKSMIFLPMAISFVGAATTFRLIYSYRPEGFGTNIGLLNGIMDLFGRAPVPWLSERPWNNFLLMVVMIWMQTGFAMVVLSASIKAIPDEILEAARIDGATELQVFWRITVPSIMPTIVVVATYMVINALKVFDIVFVIGGAQANHTEVVAERMINWFFIGNHDGRGAAIAVILFLAVIPVMIWNVRKFREQELVR